MDEMLAPKRHLFAHLLEMLDFHVDLRLYAHWRDESLNKLLRVACRQLSQTTFEATLLLVMERLLEKEREKGQRPIRDAAR